MHVQPRYLLNVLIMSFALSAGASAQQVELAPDHPERYTVVKGDTLWSIATRFLKTPWHWPKVWRINEGINNPHLIYPGDVILLRMVNGQPELSVLPTEKLTEGGTPTTGETPPTTTPSVVSTVTPPVGGVTKLQPQVRDAPILGAIPTIPPNIIVPFLTQPLLVGKRELDDAGYVTVGLDDRIALGDGSEFYARGIKSDGETEYFRIFRPGAAIKHPETGEVLAYEATYLGDAQLLETGDPTKLVVTSVRQEILPRDRLLAAPQNVALPYYFPHAPTKPVKGYIVSALNAVAEIGSHSIVAVSLGERDGMEEGHVLRVMRHVGKHKDPVTRKTYALPDEESALALVFKTFEKASYALILNASRPVHLKDAVITP